MPAALLPKQASRADLAAAADSGAAHADGAAARSRADGNSPGTTEGAAADRRGGSKGRSGGRKKKQRAGVGGGTLAIPDPPAVGKWELLASTVEEVQVCVGGCM